LSIRSFMNLRSHEPIRDDTMRLRAKPLGTEGT
jgi:hypothetical protein